VAVDAVSLAHRQVHELSDGERQRIMVARALAQEPLLMVLDEPTAFLDLPRRVEMMRLLRCLARETNRVLLLSTHDLDLALRSADALWLLAPGGVLHSGAPEDLVLGGAFEATFASDGIAFDRRHGSFQVHPPAQRRANLVGDGLIALWTARALERAGYTVGADNTAAVLQVTISDDAGRPCWELGVPGGSSRKVGSLHALTALLRTGHMVVADPAADPKLDRMEEGKSMKIYTRTGDSGTTGLWGGTRVDKDALRVHAYGTVDECNAAIGVARASAIDAELDQLLAGIQDMLFVVGADLTAIKDSPHIPRVQAADVTTLEQIIDRLEETLEPLRQFILPGGSPAAAHLHLARTICRRAERAVVALARDEPVNAEVVIYLNRLSDCLFVLARSANARAAIADVAWQSPRQQQSDH
jgi:ATP:cob(I)alamin adenosyltransferase